LTRQYSGGELCVSEGLVAFEANPHHRRAQFVVLTDKGRQTFEAAMRLQVPWVNGLADWFLVKDIEAARHCVTALRKRLEENNEPEEQPERLCKNRPLQRCD
jgi:DNA-binding MarR family transcriptional regulator